MPRMRSIVLVIVLVVVLVVAGAVGLWAMLSANNDQSSSSGTTEPPNPRNRCSQPAAWSRTCRPS
jgi:flagellar basal body-associated protein FliL